MKTISDIYKNSFFKNRHKLSWRVPIVCDAVNRTFIFKSIIDIGCATGDFLEEFEKRGKIIAGIEGSDNARRFLRVDPAKIYNVDLRYGLSPLGMRFDLVISLEVAEHIEEKYSDNYISTLKQFSDNILITAAPPGQKGLHHVNCQPAKYWIDRFSGNGFEFNKEKTRKFKKELFIYREKKGINCYYNNALVFTNNNRKRRK